MTDAVLGNIVATAGTIAGVVLGYLLSRRQAAGERRSELRSFLDAAQWELTDAKEVANASSPMSIRFPTVEIIVQRGMLAQLPLQLRQRLLYTRSLATALNESCNLLVEGRDKGLLESKAGQALMAHHVELAHRFLPLLEDCVAALGDHLNRLSTGRFRRLWNWLCRRKTISATPRI